jgi:hypothetical protein
MGRGSFSCEEMSGESNFCLTVELNQNLLILHYLTDLTKESDVGGM